MIHPEPIIKKVEGYIGNPNKEIITNAFEFANKMHEGMKRKSGEDYIIHPYTVALILADANADEHTIAAGLLHDVVEDCSCTIMEIEMKFGSDVAVMVDGVTKLEKLPLIGKNEYDTANLRKMLFSAANDVRVILIKLADRLHNMRTLHYHSPEKQKEIAKETLDIYAPLAYRLGFGNIKVELEDLGFKYSMPEQYNDLLSKLEDTKFQREKRMEAVQGFIEEELKKININGKIYGRVKHLYSIYKKVIDRDYDLSRMYDLVALRVITETVGECYEVVRIIQKTWRTIPETFKDYIVTPKPNGYCSIHLSIIAEDGKPVEFQIRTKDMHVFAEEGGAVHWGYKGINHGQMFDRKIQWLKQLLELQKEGQESEFIENIKVDLFSDSIFVYTPKNDIIELPKDSCPIDFAYNIHSSIGDKCTGAYVNGKFVSMKSSLKNGDIIEIITSNSQRPSIEWLKHVRSTKARLYIRRAIKRSGRIPTRGIVHEEKEKKEVKEYFIQVEGMKNCKPVFSLCCKPLPGDDIKGFVVSLGKVKIHKSDCFQITKIKSSKIVKSGWAEEINSLVELNVEGEDRVGFMAELLNALSRLGINITSAKGKIMHNNLGLCSFGFNVSNLSTLCVIIEKLQKIKGVKKIYIGKVSSS